ncbi:GIY-YIG nuclease family protein [Chloroflexota bacterium]
MLRLRRKRGNICGYWDCAKLIPDDSFLCDAHYEAWVSGLIDRCPKCRRFKDVMYQQCLDCYFGRPVAQWEPSVVIPTPKQSYRLEYSDAWIDGYMELDRFFVYILEFGEGDFRIGYTEDIRKRLSEYRNDKTSPPSERNPKLQYLQLIATEKAAELREAELKRLIESNPDQIRLMISEFHRHMREFGLEE